MLQLLIISSHAMLLVCRVCDGLGDWMVIFVIQDMRWDDCFRSNVAYSLSVLLLKLHAVSPCCAYLLFCVAFLVLFCSVSFCLNSHKLPSVAICVKIG